MYLKKIVAILSLAVYLVASCGIVVNSHFCMKRLVAVHLFESKADACARCGMDMDKDNRCCHDEVKVIKLINDQNRIPVLLFELSGLTATERPLSEYLALPFFNTSPFVASQCHAPPALSFPDIYLKNGVFRI